MTQKELILKEIDDLSDDLDEILDFIKFLKYKRAQEKLEITVASESSLKKDWLDPVEDEAWQNL